SPFGQRIVLKLIATENSANLDKYFDQALKYTKLLSAEET
ncbi:1885_t:CDS:1, partial [Funneliformis geosporum]